MSNEIRRGSLEHRLLKALVECARQDVLPTIDQLVYVVYGERITYETRVAVTQAINVLFEAGLINRLKMPVEE
jgi:hypothetical protein